MATVSRQFHFQELDAESFRKIYDFRDKHLGEINVSFGSTPGEAIIEWNTSDQLRLLEELEKTIVAGEK